MGTSKILIDGVGIDLTQDTVAANKMLAGTKAHDSNGDSVTGSITSKAAATYTPNTADQTIASGQYLSGAQTIKGDANLVAGNIKQGVSIFGVAGSITPAKPEQSKTLTLGATAPSAVTPDSGKVLSSVPVVLDTSVIKAENIAKDVTMLGVTGTHEGGGGGSSGGHLKDMQLRSVQTPLLLKDIFVDACMFENGLFEFGRLSSNVTFKDCVFENCHVRCTQEIHDAIVNGENNDYSTAGFTIIS